MTATHILVGIGEIQAVQGEAIFVCLGLGSCIGIAIMDADSNISGMAHIMLPKKLPNQTDYRPAKYADEGVIALVETLERMGANRSQMKAAICGGAQVVHGQSTNAQLQFGARNSVAVEAELLALGVPLVAADTGGNFGRTFTFDTSTAIVTSRTPTTPDSLLCRLN